MRRRGEAGRAGVAALVLGAALVAPAAAPGGLLAALNDVRARGCGGRPGATIALRSVARLDDAAGRLARGASLADALIGAGHRVPRATFIHVGGAVDAVAVARTIARDGCATVLDPDLRDVGVAWSGRDVWVVLATAPVGETLADGVRVRREIVERANAARVRSRRCGTRTVGPAAPLRVSAALERAALAHARDMAARGAASHTGSDGSRPADRVGRQGYRWGLVGENVAAGQTSAEKVVAEWLGSSGHCENLMDPRFTDTGVAYVVDAASPTPVYWVQLFAAPRP